MAKIAVLDYGIGNVKSICNALENVGAEPLLTGVQEEILTCDGLIIPGVGAFSHGMQKLTSAGMVDFIKTYAASGRPILGICLGMQMLFSDSDEFGFTEGLGLIEGNVRRIDSGLERNIKLPHVGWSKLESENVPWKGTILDEVDASKEMYFVHTFAVESKDKSSLLSKTSYEGVDFCSTVKFGNVYGCQFHPEKSSEEGLKIIKNFCKVSEEYVSV